MFNLGVPVSSEGGHVSFQNNVPDPVASGKELPTFKFELEKSQGRVIDGSYGKEAFGSGGRWRQETLRPGDVGYIPQGFGHLIENIGGTTARNLIVFNSGHYQTIDLSQWIAGNSLDVLATNFGQDAKVFETFPRRNVFITK